MFILYKERYLLLVFFSIQRIIWRKSIEDGKVFVNQLKVKIRYSFQFCNLPVVDCGEVQ